MRFQLSGDYENAIKVCTEQLKIKPSNGTAYHLRATTYILLNELTLAESDFKNSLIFSNSDDVKERDYIGLGKIYRKSGQFEKSKEYYLQALKLNKDNALTYCNLAILAFDWLGPDSELVEPSYMNALELDPTSCSFGYKKMGEKSIQKKEYDKAITFFSLAIETETEKSLSINEYYNRATCFFQVKKYNDAVSDFKTCIVMMPNDIQSYLWLGQTYYAQGQKLEACNLLKKANEINESFERNSENRQQILNYLKTYSCK